MKLYSKDQRECFVNLLRRTKERQKKLFLKAYNTDLDLDKSTIRAIANLEYLRSQAVHLSR